MFSCLCVIQEVLVSILSSGLNFFLEIIMTSLMCKKYIMILYKNSLFMVTDLMKIYKLLTYLVIVFTRLCLCTYASHVQVVFMSVGGQDM